MHTGGHCDVGSYALRNNENLLNYVKTKVGGVLEVEMLLANGKKISKHYFPHDSCPVKFFEKIAEHLNSPPILNKLKNTRVDRIDFDFKVNNIDIRAGINPANKLISFFPIT